MESSPRITVKLSILNKFFHAGCMCCLMKIFFLDLS